MQVSSRNLGRSKRKFLTLPITPSVERAEYFINSLSVCNILLFGKAIGVDEGLVPEESTRSTHFDDDTWRAGGIVPYWTESASLCRLRFCSKGFAAIAKLWRFVMINELRIKRILFAAPCLSTARGCSVPGSCDPQQNGLINRGGSFSGSHGAFSFRQLLLRACENDLSGFHEV
jgi:hypothetical protein